MRFRLFQQAVTQYPEVVASALDPVEHYVVEGCHEGKNPNSWFDTEYYLNANPDVALSELNPFYHFLLFGCSEKRLPRMPAFAKGAETRVSYRGISADIPSLITPEDCYRLKQTFIGKLVIAIWVSCSPRNATQTFIHLSKVLRDSGYTVLFLVDRFTIRDMHVYLDSDEICNLYFFRDRELFRYLDCISILFTCEGSIGYTTKLEGFLGNLVLLGHASEAVHPKQNPPQLAADFVIANPTINKNFGYNLYPNIAKMNSQDKLTLIPGYLKNDLIASKCKRVCTSKLKQVAMFGTLETVAPSRNAEVVIAAYCEFIQLFFEAFPEWKFVLRPFPGDTKNPIYSEISRRYCNHKYFIYDTGNDGYEYLATSVVLFTDYSTVYSNFCHGTLRPVIWFRPDDKNAAAGRCLDRTYGYLTTTPQEAMDALDDALQNLEQWEEKISKARDLKTPHFGETAKHICKHIDNIANNTPAQGWITFDKGNTPCQRICDYIKLLKPAHAKTTLSPHMIACYFDWSTKQHGYNKKIALAVIRVYILQWPHPSPPYKHREFFGQIIQAFCVQHRAAIVGLLRYMVRTQPGKCAPLVWLAEVLSRWEPEAPDFQSILDKLLAFPMDYVLGRITARILVKHRNAPLAALSVMENALGADVVLDVPSYTMHAAILWKIRQYEKCEDFITIWESRCNVQWIPFQLLIFKILLRLRLSFQYDMPNFFWETGIIGGTLTSWFPLPEHLSVAEAVVREYIAKDDTLPWAWALIGQIHNSRWQLDEAIHCALKVINLQPDVLSHRNTLAEIYRKKGDSVAAEQLALDTLQISPAQGWAYIQLSHIKNSRNELEDAIYCAKQAVSVQPEALYFRNTLADLLRKKGNLLSVEDVVQKALAKNPNQGWAYIQMSHVHNSRNELDDAISCARQAVAVQPEVLAHRNTLAEFLRKQRNFAAVEELARFALNLDPHQGWAYIQLSYIYEDRKELDSAIACVRKAVEVQPDALWHRNTLATLLRKQSDFEQAALIAREALHLNPYQSWPYIQLSHVHSAYGNSHQAISCMRKALEIDPYSTWNAKLLDDLLIAQKRQIATVEK